MTGQVVACLEVAGLAFTAGLLLMLVPERRRGFPVGELVRLEQRLGNQQ